MSYSNQVTGYYLFPKPQNKKKIVLIKLAELHINFLILKIIGPQNLPFK